MEGYTPAYTVINEARATKTVVTSEEWNALFNLLATQGNSTATALYNFITLIEGSTGAADVGGTPITGVTGTTVQTIMVGLKALIDACYTRAATDALLATKESVTDANALVKTIAFNAADGKFTITTQGGTVSVIDTALEKVAVNFAYNATTQALDLTLADGSTTSVSLSAFITETEFVDSNTIDFSVNDHVVTASIKSGSITDAMLSSTLATALIGYKTAAETAATNAAASEANALTYKNAAGVSAQNAATSEANALTYKNAALASKNAAATSEINAAGSADDAAASAAQAAAIVGQKVTSFNGRDGVVTPAEGDYTAVMVGAVPNTDKGIANGVATLDEDGKVPTGQLPTLIQTDATVELTDSVAAALGLDPANDPQVNDVLLACNGQIGDIKITARTDLGENWLLCNGQNVDSADYPDLTPLLSTDKWSWNVSTNNSITTWATLRFAYGGGIYVLYGKNGYDAGTGQSKIGLYYTDDITKPLSQWTYKDTGITASYQFVIKYLNGNWYCVTVATLHKATTINGTWEFLGSRMATSGINSVDIDYYDGRWAIIMTANNTTTGTYIFSNTDSEPYFALTNQTTSRVGLSRIKNINGSWFALVVGGGNIYSALIADFSVISYASVVQSSAIPDIYYEDSKYHLLVTGPSSTYPDKHLTSTNGTTWTVLTTGTTYGAGIIRKLGSNYGKIQTSGFAIENVFSPADSYFSKSGLPCPPTDLIYINGVYIAICINGSLPYISITDRLIDTVAPIISISNVYTYIRGK